MKKSTKIIGISLIALTGLGLFFLNKNNSKTKNGGGYIDDSQSSDIYFNPKSIADTLYEAMKSSGKSLFNTVGLSIGTQRDVIFEALANVTAVQFNSVVKSFGLKPYNKLTGGQIFPIWSKPTHYGLKTWLKSELNDADYKILKNNYPKNL
jgi:hypothetical protein